MAADTGALAVKIEAEIHLSAIDMQLQRALMGLEIVVPLALQDAVVRITVLAEEDSVVDILVARAAVTRIKANAQPDQLIAAHTWQMTHVFV